MRLTRATAADAAALAGLGHNVLDAWSQQQFVQEMHNACSTTWMQRWAQIPVSGIVFWQVADELQILNLVVGVAWRRRGLGRRLLQTVLDYGRCSGQRHAVLEVRADNLAALRLYASLGFTVMGYRTAYYGASGADAVLMQYTLHPQTPNGSP